MLHEGLGCVALWRDFPQNLAQATGYGVVAWSRAGYGQSDPVQLPRPLDYMTREAIDFLPGVLETIGYRDGILLGHSDGACLRETSRAPRATFVPSVPSCDAASTCALPVVHGIHQRVSW